MSKLADVMQRQNASLEHDMTKSELARKSMEKELYRLKCDLKKEMNRSARAQRQQQAEIQEYKKMVRDLASRLDSRR